MDKLQRVHLFFIGRVQGVGYRRFVKQQAARLELNGWVQNLPDGRVESVIEGYDVKIMLLIEKCKRGPPLSNVKNVILSVEPFTGELKGFKIKY